MTAALRHQYYLAADLAPLWSTDDPKVTQVAQGSASAGEHVIFQVRWQADAVQACRYRMQGCDYFIAAVVYLAEWLVGRTSQQCADFSAETLSAHFDMPAHKQHVVQVIVAVIEALSAIQ